MDFVGSVFVYVFVTSGNCQHPLTSGQIVGKADVVFEFVSEFLFLQVVITPDNDPRILLRRFVNIGSYIKLY